jgi:hypothetical protein
MTGKVRHIVQIRGEIVARGSYTLYVVRYKSPTQTYNVTT